MRSVFIRRSVPAVALLLAIFSAPLAAAETRVINEVVVTAAPFRDLLQPVTVLDEADLLRRRASSLGETLDREPGVSSSYFGPAASRPVIRGLAGPRVLVLADGIAALDVSDVSADHATTLEPLLVDRVEVVRGPATLLFGSGAAGGVVNVLDGRVPRQLPDSAVTGMAEVRLDSAAESHAAVGRLDGGIGDFAWHLDGFARDAEDLDIPGFATFSAADRPVDEQRGTLRNSAGDNTGATAGLSWIRPRGYLGLALSQQDSRYGLPGPAEELPPGEEAIFPGPLLDLHQTRVDLRAGYRPDGLFESLELAAGTNNYQHTEIEATGEPGTVFDNEAWQLRVQGVHGAVADWRGALGLQLDHRDFSAVGAEAFVPATTTTAAGLFVVERRRWAAGTLELGARLEALDHDTSGALPDYDKNAVSLAAGFTRDASKDTRLTASVTRTQRHPAAEELYSDGPHLATRQFELGLLVEPGASAELETATNLELGVTQNLRGSTLLVSAFYNRIDDYIFQLTTTDVEDDLPVAPYAQEDARFWGLEAELQSPVVAIAGWGTDARLFADYVHAELANGDKLPRIPPLRAGLELGFERGPVRLGVEAIHHARQDRVSSFETASYTLLGASLVWSGAAGAADWQLFVEGSNLADEDARRSTSFLAAFAPLPGRSLEVSWRVKY
jgi:iron complex outermembrane recepter protein